MKKYVDDKYTHLAEDIEKIRQKYRMYISFSGHQAAKAIVLEILWNALDECRNPRSPANEIEVVYDEREDKIRVTDNGRGIPLDLLENVLTTLNSGSNIDSGAKVDLKTNTLGRNGVGTLAMTALGAYTRVFSRRGGTENKAKEIIFHEGKKVHEEIVSCQSNDHGLTVEFTPSKILGKSTRIIWNDIRLELINLQFLNDKKIKMKSLYIDKNGDTTKEEYKTQNFEEILSYRHNKQDLISDKIRLNIEDDNIIEDLGGKKFKRFINMDIAFVYSSGEFNYMDSFCNGNNTIDFGSHFDGTMEAICRYFQNVTKASLSERDKLDIKWDDVRTGLSLVVSLNTNMEELFTSQTKHKILNDDLEKLIKEKMVDTLNIYFSDSPTRLKELINIVKTNARARREGDKARNAVVKEVLNNWGAFKLKNYEPCTNKGREYKELYIIEGDSAKGSLKLSRDPKFQALFAIRGVSANVFKLDLAGVLANKEFEALIKVMGCNVGPKFDLSKLQFDKIVIASDADVDALFIRSLLLSFFFKIFPEIIEDGRLFIAEPPLYRINDKKNPFVVNKEDYTKRYVKEVMKEYKIGHVDQKIDKFVPIDKESIKQILTDTSSYIDDIHLLSNHYKVNDRMMEIIVSSIANYGVPDRKIHDQKLKTLEREISDEFPEMYYDETDNLFKGIIDGRYQSIEVSNRLARKAKGVIELLDNYSEWSRKFHLRDNKTGTEQEVSLLEALKVLKKFQPDIVARFKGLGENEADDIKVTLMDPNTRSLIKIFISDMENDMKIFQMLRGSTPQDAAARKEMMKAFRIHRDLIDT